MVERLMGTRTKVLLLLLDGPKNIQELVGAIGKRNTAIHQEIKPLLTDGIIGKAGRTYHLTALGRAKAMLQRNMVDFSQVEDAYREFWKSHDLSGIPDTLLCRLGDLVGSELIRDCPDAPINQQEAFIEILTRAKEIRGISGIIEPGYAEAILAALEGGAHVELILSEWVIGQIEPEMLRKAQSYENFHLYQLEGLKVAFTVTDELISLALYDLAGVYDPWQDLICEGERAVTWGRELWDGYKEKAKVIE